MYLTLCLLVFCETVSLIRSQGQDGKYLHPDYHFIKSSKSRAVNEKEINGDYWVESAQDMILKKLKTRPNENVAKNVIMFLGDGLSIPTLAATRVYYGGEEKELSFEKLPYTALSKTYCVDAQTADSACTATAYLAGVKNNIGVIGVTAAVQENDCDATLIKENQVESIAKWSQDVGKRTGIVTNTEITDASPAGAYAKIANRRWQTDAAVKGSGADPNKCRDIAYQLLNSEPGKNFNIILGGGAQKFLHNETLDPFGGRGERTDGLDLISNWLNDKTDEGKQAEFVWNKTGLLNLNHQNTEYVLGLFASTDLPYNLERDDSTIPSLEEMTAAAINAVSIGQGAENGYFLFIEGGRIDHAHHDTTAKKAFDETIEFSKAVQKALDMTSEEDTLIVVTADHAHTMSISGYPDRGNPILGVAGLDDYGGARLTINYANGPGVVNASHDYGLDDTKDDNYVFPSVSYLQWETHSADDVGIFARGPWAHLFTGVLEQHTIPHFMAYASCVGDGLTVCSWAVRNVASLGIPLLTLVMLLHALLFN